MPRFSRWLLIATPDSWFGLPPRYYGPACYELGIGTSPDEVQVMHVGETKSVLDRMISYASQGSHLRDLIVSERGHGQSLFCRIQLKMSKQAAYAMQNALIARRRAAGDPYPWNKAGNLGRLLAPPDRPRPVRSL